MAVRRRARAELQSAPPALHERALADLHYIRRTMESASTFTAFSGWGLALIGAITIPAGWWATRLAGRERWLAAWLALAAISVAIAASITWWKARRTQQPLLASPARRFALGLAPPLAAGAVVTAALVRHGEVVWSEALGIKEPGVEATTDLQYRIGSITKTFCAVTIMQLRDEGRLSLDDPIGVHLPDVPLEGPTIRRMLSHSSGLQREPACGPRS